MLPPFPQSVKDPDSQKPFESLFAAKTMIMCNAEITGFRWGNAFIYL